MVQTGLKRNRAHEHLESTISLFPLLSIPYFGITGPSSTFWSQLDFLMSTGHSRKTHRMVQSQSAISSNKLKNKRPGPLLAMLGGEYLTFSFSRKLKQEVKAFQVIFYFHLFIENRLLKLLSTKV